MLKSGFTNYKVAQKIITNLRSLKITKLCNIITKLRRNYKVAQNNYKVAQKLQSCAKITKLRRTNVIPKRQFSLTQFILKICTMINSMKLKQTKHYRRFIPKSTT